MTKKPLPKFTKEQLLPKEVRGLFRIPSQLMKNFVKPIKEYPDVVKAAVIDTIQSEIPILGLLFNTSKKDKQKKKAENQQQTITKSLQSIVEELRVIRRLREGSLRYDARARKYYTDKGKLVKPETLFPSQTPTKPVQKPSTTTLKRVGVGVLTIGGIIALFKPEELFGFFKGFFKEAASSVVNSVIPESIKSLVDLFVKPKDKTPAEHIKEFRTSLEAAEDEATQAQREMEADDLESLIQKDQKQLETLSEKTENAVKSVEQPKETPGTLTTSEGVPVTTTTGEPITTPSSPKTAEVAAEVVSPVAKPTITSTRGGDVVEMFREELGAIGVTDAQEQANLLAQIQAESGFKSRSENVGGYSAEWLLRTFPRTPSRPWGFASLEDARNTKQAGAEAVANRIYGGRMGNAAEEGYKYRGRGFIQLTGKDNYRKFGRLVGVDLVSDPDKANDPAIAVKIAVAYYKEKLKGGVNFASIADVTKAVGPANLSEQIKLREKYAQGFLEASSPEKGMALETRSRAMLKNPGNKSTSFIAIENTNYVVLPPG